METYCGENERERLTGGVCAPLEKAVGVRWDGGSWSAAAGSVARKLEIWPAGVSIMRHQRRTR